MRLFLIVAWSAPVWAATSPPKDSGDSGIYDTGDSGDSGDTGDTGDSGDSGGVVPLPPENTYDGHLDGELAYQMAGDEGGCATPGTRPVALVVPLVLVGVAVGRLRRPRR